MLTGSPIGGWNRILRDKNAQRTGTFCKHGQHDGDQRAKITCQISQTRSTVPSPRPRSPVYLEARKHFLCFQKYSALFSPIPFFCWFVFSNWSCRRRFLAESRTFCVVASETFAAFYLIFWASIFVLIFLLSFPFFSKFYAIFAFIFGVSVAFGHESWFICTFFCCLLCAGYFRFSQ